MRLRTLSISAELGSPRQIIALTGSMSNFVVVIRALINSSLHLNVVIFDLETGRELRRVANLDKPQFDRAVLDLARQGRVMLHRS